jgi:hypothetical protein
VSIHVLAHTLSTHQQNRKGEGEDMMVKTQKYAFKLLFEMAQKMPPQGVK